MEGIAIDGLLPLNSFLWKGILMLLGPEVLN